MTSSSDSKSTLDVRLHFLPLNRQPSILFKKGSKIYCAFVDASKAFD